MRASEHERVGVLKLFGEGLREINARDLLGHGMINPSFFDQRNQQRARLFASLEAARFESLAVGMAADRGLGADHHDLAVFRSRPGGLGAGFNDSNHGDVSR